MTTQKTTSPHLFLVDGSGFIFRAFHALPPLNRPDGTPVNAVLGFSNMLLKLLSDQEVDHLAVIFDHSRASFRQEIYPAYKANRDETPDALIPQFDLIRRACTAFNVPHLDKQGFEADDIIATYVRVARSQGFDVTIVSSDKDLMQLIAPGVVMWDPMKNRLLGREAVEEKFGVGPEKVVDVQALIGDSSDNIPGVPGIGVKTASLLIQAFGDLDTLLARAHEIPQNKRRQTLMDHREEALLSRRLAQLDANVDVSPDLSVFKRSPLPSQTLEDFMVENDFKSLLARVRREGLVSSNQSSTVSSPQESARAPHEHIRLDSAAALKAWLTNVSYEGVLALSLHTKPLDAFNTDLEGVSLALSSTKTAYIPFGTPGIAGDLFTPKSEGIEGIVPKDFFSILGPFLTDSGTLKIFHDAKKDLALLHQKGCQVQHFEDTLVMSYCLDGSRHEHTLEALALTHCGVEEGALSHESSSGIVKSLYDMFSKRLFDEKRLSLYKALDLPVVSILLAMEEKGVGLNAVALEELSVDLEARMNVFEKEIHALAGREFNVGSSQQLAEVLFTDQGLVTGKKGKTGAFSTRADELERLAGQGSHLAEKVLSWRQLAKLKSTYTNALVTQINPRTKRVHSTFSMTSTSTGRLASSQPNLQNIPVRTSEGRKIRRAFVPENGSVFVCLDYSQIELRLLAHMAHIPTLKEAFQKGQDIHARTASDVFHVPLEEVTPDMRRRAKAINFGIIYGISAFGLARQLSVPQSQARDYIAAYYAKYPGIVAYMDGVKESAMANGYVETLEGRRCFIAGLNDPNPARRNFALRQAINAPLQGSAADLMKKAMIRANAAVPKVCPQARLVLQVHDELVFEVPQNQAPTFAMALKEVMEKVMTLEVPLVVEFGIGENWDAAHA
jgi:DNA polymerase I